MILNFFCLQALIIHELGLGDKGKWRSTLRLKNFNLNIILSCNMFIQLQLLIFFSNWHCKPMHDRKVNPFTFGPCSLKLIITNPGFNFNLGPYFFWQKVLSLLILTCFTWNTLYYNIVGENNLWELYITILRSDLNSNFLRTLGYLNPHLSEQAQEIWPKNPLWS